MEKPLFLPWKTTNKKVTKARFFFLFFLPLPLSILVDLLWPLGKIFLAKSIVGLSTQLIHVRTKEKKPKSILSVLGVFWHHQVLLSHIIVLVATIFRSRHRLIFFTCDTIHFSSFFSFGQVSPEWNGGGGGRRRKEGGPNGKRKEEEEGAQRKGGEEEERRHFSVQNLEWSQVRTGKKHYTITSFESKHIIHFPTLHSAFLFFHQPIFWSFFVCPLSLPRLRPQQAPFIVKGCGRCGVAIKGGGGTNVAAFHSSSSSVRWDSWQGRSKASFFFPLLWRRLQSGNDQTTKKEDGRKQRAAWRQKKPRKRELEGKGFKEKGFEPSECCVVCSGGILGTPTVRLLLSTGQLIAKVVAKVVFISNVSILGESRIPSLRLCSNRIIENAGGTWHFR